MSPSGSGTPPSGAKSVSTLRTEEFYSRIYQQVATGIAITNWQGVFQECNPAFCALVGYTEEELRTIDFVSLIHPEDRQANLLQVRRLQVGEIPSFEIENRYIHKNGEPVWGRKFVSVLHGENKEPTHLIALVTDVTERKRAAEVIKESEMRFRRIVETTNEGVWLLDSKLQTSYVNRQMAGMLGYESGDMVGRSVFDFYFSEDVDHKRQVLTRREQGVREQLEERLRRRDGSELWVRMSATPMFGQDGEFEGAFAMVCDITERKRAQERLREYERVVEVLGDRIMVVDREYRYVMANAAFLNYRGFEKDQVIGHTVAEIVGKETFEANIKEQFDECFRGKVVQREVKYSYPKLGPRNIAASYFPIRGPLGIDRIACVLRDVTEQKAAEEALRESEARFRLIANSAPVMIWMSGPDKLCNYFNQPWFEFTGRGLEA